MFVKQNLLVALIHFGKICPVVSKRQRKTNGIAAIAQ